MPDLKALKDPSRPAPRPASFRVVPVAQSPAFTQVLAVNSNRRSFLMGQNFNTTLLLTPQDPAQAAASSNANIIIGHVNPQWIYLDRDQIGDLVTQAWSAATIEASGAIWVFEVEEY
jgi:hypothetical protein